MIIDTHVHFWDPARGDDILIASFLKTCGPI
jgi:predicted TIM-barrel fold metal-dependent hydrolase